MGGNGFEGDLAGVGHLHLVQQEIGQLILMLQFVRNRCEERVKSIEISFWKIRGFFFFTFFLRVVCINSML